MSNAEPEISPEITEAKPHRRRFSWIWLIPIAAAAVAAYLGYSTFSTRGPLVTIRFSSADGLTAGQTQVRYKSVNIGTVDSIALTDDLARVNVRIRMQKDVEDRLTANARFWVVRPRLTASNVSGLETIVSGAYIEFDPGAPGGEKKRAFRGLDDPPGVRSDEPGRVFTLHTHRLGALDRGSVVFFRDVAVGEVLSYDPPALDGMVTLRAFIRSPYEGYLRKGSRFWNTSGVSVGFGPNGVKVEVASLRAALAGGIAFDTPPELRNQPTAPDDVVYNLYDNQEAAITATSADRLEFLTYLDGSVSGLAEGSPVEMRGIRIGNVQKVELAYDRQSDRFVVPVRIAIEPRNIAFPDGRPQEEVLAAATRLVREGFRLQLRSGNLLTGQKVISLDLVPDAPPAEVRIENGTIVLPSVGGDSDNIMAAVGAMAGKLERFPLDEIGQNLNAALASVNGVVGGPELKDALGSLSGALGQVQELVRKADGGITPLLRRLPEIANNLDQAVRRANTAVGSIERGYGGDSSFNRQLDRTLQQVTDAARSIRLLADLLGRHPEALIRGRTE
ncbi:MlaD family protein [Siccirubricoccus sp. KC 17139]|uniref:MlaD family protein n=1 Tax=Siccirubricoccus soli TaxID=2899147 RepID=A0ABT1D3N3_9PROT|nr:MlaD family protein [Siccirubricoccus soli]MCO6416542.1 MlaD family protein [Siccirubricoccus soli]MCP2682677.1 MlaD family protein [Siccirubricoccus soli]